MTTGKAHRRITGIGIPAGGGEGEERHYFTTCRCTIGEDHQDPDVMYSEYDPDEDEDDMEGEPLSVYDAADIWRSNGEDPDYSFGYDEDELSRAAEEE